MMNVHGLRRNVKNVVKNYTDAQIKVREATSNDPWGPSGTLMSEISDLTYNVVAFSEIMYVLWKRLNDHGKNWKHVYKALVLMEYLLKSGSEKVAQQCKERIFAIETLKDFQYVEENKDQGVNVREKARQLVSLLKDDDRLKNERARALKARERFAQATAGVRREFIQREQDSTEFMQPQPPFDEEYISQGLFLSELEQVRPQTIGEEELQLQLALAMSKEEADQTERLKRNDELRLQMALSESKESFEHTSQPDEEIKKPAPSAMHDLMEVFANVQETRHVMHDPWGMPIETAERRRYPHSYTIPSGLNHNTISASDDANPNVSELGVENNNPVNLNATLISPDLITSNVVSSSGPYDMANMRKSISADVAISDFTQQNTSPQRFLGDNANLVNLDSLIEFRSPAASALTSSSNPFQAAKSSPPTINEIRVQGGNTSTPSSGTLTNQTLNDAAAAQPSNNPFL